MTGERITHRQGSHQGDAMPGRASDPLMIPATLWQHPETVEALRNRDIGRLFHLLRQYAGASQTQIAIACGMTQGRVSEIMKSRGRQVNALDVFERIADGLDMPDQARMTLGLAPRTHDSAAAQPSEPHPPALIPSRDGLDQPHNLDLPGALSGLSGNGGTPSNAQPFGLTAADPETRDRVAHATQRPSRLDTHAIDAFAAMLAGQRRLEDRIGAATLVDPVTAQLPLLTEMLRDAPLSHRAKLAEVTSEWATFAGWLHTAVGRDDAAKLLFQRAEELADEGADATLAATATSFRGYLARLRDQPRAAIRWTAAALHTPGSHPSQRAYDSVQLAQGYATLGDEEQMRHYLDQAADLAAQAQEPPPSVYWYNEPFFHVQIGLAHLEAHQYRDAADMIAAGLAAMPAEQRQAEWVAEYDEALATAQDRT